jgi:hypothetical protein
VSAVPVVAVVVAVTAAVVVGAVPFMLFKLLFGWQQVSPCNRNEPPVAVVTTLVLYLVLVLTPQAVT